MATLDSALTLFAPHRYSKNYCFSSKPPDTIKLHFSNSLLSLSRHILFFSPTLSSKASSNRRLPFESLCTALQEVETEGNAISEQQTQTTNVKKKLYVSNLPWSLSAAEIKSLFAQCGTVTDVEIIMYKDGRSRGYAFVTMASGEEAQAAIDKLNSHEISGRIIRVELAKRFKKPPPQRPPGPSAGEAHHKIFVSNLAWKVMASHLREFFTENFKRPVSARVIFDRPSGSPAGYGFVSYDTKEEVEDAISALDGKELMGRPLRLQIGQKNVEEAGTEEDEGVEEAGIEQDEGPSYNDQLEES